MILTSDGKRAFMLARYGCDSILDLETGIIKMGVVFDFGLQHFNVALSSDDQIFAVLGLDSNGGTIITLIHAVNGSHLRVQSFNDSIFSLSNTTAPRDFWLEMNDSYSTVWNTEKNICYNSIDITKETIQILHNQPRSKKDRGEMSKELLVVTLQSMQTQRYSTIKNTRIYSTATETTSIIMH